MLLDGRTQRFGALRASVGRLSSVQSCLGFLDDGCWCVKIRLTNGKTNHFWAWWRQEGSETRTNMCEVRIQFWQAIFLLNSDESSGELPLKARMIFSPSDGFWSTDGDSNSGLRICNPAHSHSDIRAVSTPSGMTYFNAPLASVASLEDSLNPPVASNNHVGR